MMQKLTISPSNHGQLNTLNLQLGTYVHTDIQRRKTHQSRNTAACFCTSLNPVCETYLK